MGVLPIEQLHHNQQKYPVAVELQLLPSLQLLLGKVKSSFAPFYTSLMVVRTASFVPESWIKTNAWNIMTRLISKNPSLLV